MEFKKKDTPESLTSIIRHCSVSFLKFIYIYICVWWCDDAMAVIFILHSYNRMCCMFVCLLIGRSCFMYGFLSDWAKRKMVASVSVKKGSSYVLIFTFRNIIANDTSTHRRKACLTLLNLFVNGNIVIEKNEKKFMFNFLNIYICIFVCAISWYLYA